MRSLTEAFFNERVVCQRNALLFDLAVSTLVYELTHRLQVGVTDGQKPHTGHLMHLSTYQNSDI